MHKWKKPKKKKKRKRLRIWVEWKCGECLQIHRISFPVVLRSLLVGIKRRGGEKKTFKSLHIDYGTPLSRLNAFLNTTFYEEFHAMNYVKISYPQELLSLLESNEKIAQKYGKTS